MRKIARRTCAQHRTEVLLLKSRRRRIDLMRRNTELLEGIEMANGLAAYMRERKEVAEEKLAGVLRMLPRNSLVSHPMVEEIGRRLAPEERFRVRINDSIDDVRPNFFDAMAEKSTICELEQIVHDVVRDLDRNMVHLYLRTPDSHTAYAMSWSAVKGMTRDQFAYQLRKRVVPDMVRHTVETVFRGRL